MSCYRISKYNPMYRVSGIYTKDEWTSIYDVKLGMVEMSEYLEVEQAYLQCIVDLVDELNISRLLLVYLEDYNSYKTYRAGMALDKLQIMDFVKRVLREEQWGKLWHPTFCLAVGYEYYIHLKTTLHLNTVKSICARYGLFAEQVEDYDLFLPLRKKDKSIIKKYRKKVVPPRRFRKY